MPAMPPVRPAASGPASDAGGLGGAGGGSGGSRPAPAPPAATPRIGVLIVDDSVVARAVIGRIVDESPRFAVAESVGTVAAALDALARTQVGVVLLDVAMPGVDGISALPDLLTAGRGAHIVVVSSFADDRAAMTVRALALGAADTLVKPGTGDPSRAFAKTLLDRMEQLCPPGTSSTVSPPRAPVTASPRPVTAPADDYDIVAIGASTGGIHAIGQLLGAIPPAFQLPILITQHLPSSFMPYFAAQLQVLAGRPCEVACDRLRIRPGRVIVAPGDAHLRCVSIGDGRASIRLSTEPAASGCMPSVDPMLSTLADIFGPRLLAIVLSGMGRDGADGAVRVRAAGGCIVVQDEASSVVWGMPGAVAGLGLADAQLPPDAIGRVVASRRRP